MADTTLEAYLNWVVDQHRYLDQLGSRQTAHATPLLLNEIYISLLAKEESPWRIDVRDLNEVEQDELLTQSALEDRDQKDRQTERALYSGMLMAPPQPPPKRDVQPVDLSKLASTHDKLILLGGNGTGKTTFLRYLALRHAQAMRTGKVKLKGLGQTRLPLLLRIADYAEQRAERNLIDFLAHSVNVNQATAMPYADLLNEWLAAGKCLILLDGLDEIVEPDQRAETVRHIECFVNEHQRTGNRFVLTSRAGGYYQAPFSAEMAHFRLCNLDDMRLQQFLARWCHAVEYSEASDTDDKTKATSVQSRIDSILDIIDHDDGLRRLATTPLHLRMLADLQRAGVSLPKRRSALFRMAAETLEHDDLPPRAFDEYAAAMQLVEQPCRAASQIRQKLHQTRWQESILLAVCLYGMEFPDDVDILIKEAILGEELGGPSPYEHILYRDLLFAVRCLGDQDVGVELQQRLIDQTLAIYFEQTSVGTIIVLRELIQTSIKDLQGSRAGNHFLDAIVARLSDNSPYIRRRAAYLLSYTTLSMAATEALLEALGDESHAVRRSVIHALQHANVSQETLGPLSAALGDESVAVRIQAARALGNATLNKEVVGALLNALRDQVETVGFAAARALESATMGEDAVGTLIKTIEEPSDYVQQHAVRALMNATAYLPRKAPYHISRSRNGTELFWGAISENSVDLLLELLASESASVRSHAATVLKNAAKSEKVENALFQLLDDESLIVRIQAASTLYNILAQRSSVPHSKKHEWDRTFLGSYTTNSEQTLNVLLIALEDESEDVRNHAAHALLSVVINGPVVNALLNARGTYFVRRTVRTVLMDATKSEDAVSALLSAMEYESVTMRRVLAANALGTVTMSEEVVDALLAALGDEASSVRSSAAESLRHATKNERVVAGLLNMLEDESSEVRKNAATGLQNARLNKEQMSIILDALEDKSGDIRTELAPALGSTHKTEAAVDELLNVLNDGPPHLQNYAAYALRNVPKSQKVMAGLLNALREESASVRTDAAIALWNTTLNEEAVNALLHALKGEPEDRRSHSTFARALKSATFSEGSVTTLCGALADESESVRGCAALALRNVAKSESVLAALLKALRDESQDVRIGAAHSLSQLASQPPLHLNNQLALQLEEALTLPEMHNVVYVRHIGHTSVKDQLFRALIAIALGPTIS